MLKNVISHHFFCTDIVVLCVQYTLMAVAKDELLFVYKDTIMN